MRSTGLVITLFSTLVLAACGGDDSGTVNPLVDAPTGNIDAAPAACTATASFGDKGALQGMAYFTPDSDTTDADMGVGDDVLEFDALLETTQPGDGVVVQLYAGYGAFKPGAGNTTGAIKTGTYQLTGEELNYATCGVCVLLATDVTSSGYADDYMATSGTVTVTAVGTAVGQTFTGTLSNVQFHHVDIGQGGATTQSPDTCTSSLTNATFTGTLAAPPAN